MSNGLSDNNICYQTRLLTSIAVVSTIMLLLFLSLFSSLLLLQRQPAYSQGDSGGTLTVITHVFNNNGGTKLASDFAICVDTDSSSSSQCQSGVEGIGAQMGFNAGSYTVRSSSSTTGYTVNYSKDCSGVMHAGETKSCTITYSDVPSSH
jgi:hypothetical protein